MTLAPSLAGCGLPKDTPQPFAFIQPCQCSSCETFCVKERNSTGGVSDISVWCLAQDCRLSTPFVAWGGAYCPSLLEGTWAAENSAGDGDGIALCATEFPFEVPLVFYTPDEKQNVIQRVVNIFPFLQLAPYSFLT